MNSGAGIKSWRWGGTRPGAGRKPKTARAVSPAAEQAGEIAALRALVVALGEHHAALEGRIRALERTRLSRPDRERLAVLLPAIAGRFGSAPFLASDVTSSTDAGLQVGCRGISTKSLGRLFSRADAWPVDGYLVESVADEAGAWLWRVLRYASNFLAATKSGTP
jgi:hypothetical protein